MCTNTSEGRVASRRVANGSAPAPGESEMDAAKDHSESMDWPPAKAHTPETRLGTRLRGTARERRGHNLPQPQNV